MDGWIHPAAGRDLLKHVRKGSKPYFDFSSKWMDELISAQGGIFFFDSTFRFSNYRNCWSSNVPALFLFFFKMAGWTNPAAGRDLFIEHHYLIRYLQECLMLKYSYPILIFL